PRASLLDIDFDFSDTAAGGTPVVPPPSAVPEMPSVPETPSSPAGLTWESEPAIELPPESVAARASEPIIDLPPEPVTLGDVPVVEGLQVAEFSADVAPLSGLEPGEFESAGTPTEQLSDLEPSSFDSEGLAAGGLEGLETTEFEAPSAALSSLPDLESEGSLVGVPGAHAAAPTDAGGFPSLDGPLDEVPALEAPTDQPPALDLPLDEPLFLEPPAPARSGALPDTDLDFELEGEAAPPAASPAIVTETMATLYLSQGFRAQAIEVYRQLVAQDPADGTLGEKLASLEAEEAAAQEPTSGPPPAPRVSMEFDTPPEGTAPAEEPPANAMLAEMSFAGVALDTPVSSGRVPTPVATLPAPAAGPTAREFLSGFVQRRATPSGAPAEEPNYAIPASLSPLDQLFGIEASAEDQRAANRLAAIGTTSAPSGGSVLDGLFTIGAPAAPAPRPSVPRASEKLKFDQFFSASSSPAAGTRPATPAPEPSSAQPPGEDDLDQFQGWLRGLTP
ncbi:MAG: hypothetical protein DYH06_21735, partial [Acidobacteria bacterium ACB2]|nr:hypothetical protein [Acidobacteria bacterium ACB2]